MIWAIIGIVAVVVLLVWWVAGVTASGTGAANVPKAPNPGDYTNAKDCHKAMAAWWGSLTAEQKILEAANHTALSARCGQHGGGK